MEWESLDALIATQPARHSYAYTYDGLNRLTAAAHEAVDYDNWSGSLVLMNEPDYSCTYDYDLNGNITSLTRKGVGRKVNMNSTIWVFGEIDHLSMIYDGNRLLKATDQCTDPTYAGAMNFKDGADKTEEYQWDANGNMTQDRNKGIYQISYNVLNLPACIEYYDGHEVDYTYAADGRKLHVSYILNPYAIVDDEGGIEEPAPDPDDPGVPEGPLGGLAGMLSGGGTPNGLRDGGEGDPIQIDEPDEPLEAQILMTRDYCSGHIYRNGVLERIENEYGFWADSCYHYRIADYQGNVRAVISQNGVLKEVNGYYPYGGITGAPATGVQPLKYGGKELDRENGLDWYDSQARMYDPLIGRTTTQDPLAEKYYNLSPYLWCAGNPMNCIDINGDSTAVLGYSNGEHIALLIQHSDKKWYYYSFNGTGFYILSSGSIGGLSVHNLGNGPFNSVAAFLDSYYNREGTYAERSSGIVNGYGYDKALVFPTNERQDELIRDTFIKTVSLGYNIITNNCGTAVKNAVQSIGIDTHIIDYDLFKYVPGFYTPIKRDTYFPSSIYKAIKENTNIIKR
jgi:RHS repeat-associated protein